MHDDADFYVGRGADALYIGTATKADPGVLDAWTLFTAGPTSDDTYVERTFRNAVARLVDKQGKRGVGPDGWPHAYEKSTRTPWTYSFHIGSVFVDHYGYPMGVIYCNLARKAAEYPSHAVHLTTS